MSSSSTVVLARCLRLGTFLAIVPFKISHNPKNGSYSCSFQKNILKFSLVFIQVMSIVSMLVLDWAGLYTQKAIHKLVYSLFNVHAICGLITLWFGTKKFEILLNSIQEFQARTDGVGNELPSGRQLRWNIGTAMTFLLGYFSVEFLVFHPGFHEGFDTAFDRYFKQAYFLIHGNNSCSYAWAHQLRDKGCVVNHSPGLTIIAGTLWICAGYTLLVVYYLNFLCFVHARVLLYLATGLLHNMKSTPKNCTGGVTQMANQLIALSNTMENALGVTVLGLCLALIPYYALGLQSLLNPKDFSTAARCMINSVAFGAILLTAAEANSKMKKVGSEIAARESVVEDMVLMTVGGRQERDEHLERMSAVLLLHQRLSSNEFGLHGKAFTITYGLVGNVFGLVVTYSVIMYQFKEGYIL